MHGVLGEKIGDGAVADVHAWAPGQVVKLFKAGVPKRFGRHEARMTGAVFAAGGPAPEVLGEVTLDGRFGIVLPRFGGPTLLQLSRTGAMPSGQAGAIIATLALAVHATPPPPDVPSLANSIEGALRFSGGVLSEPIATRLLAMMQRLPPPDTLCHGDLHSGNVIVTEDGPRLIDWTGAVRAPAAFDMAVCHIIHSELAPDLVADPGRPRALGAAVLASYAQLAGMPPAALTSAMAPYLPFVRVLALLRGVWTPAQRDRMIARIEAGLRAAH